MFNYSVDMLKKSAFQDELNTLLLQSPVPTDIVAFLRHRIREIDSRYK